MSATLPDYHTLDVYQARTSATPYRHIARARTLLAMVPQARRADIHHACTPVRVLTLDGEALEYRHELQVSPALHAYLQRAQTAKLQPDRRPFAR